MSQVRDYLREQKPYADECIEEFITHLKVANDPESDEATREFAKKIASRKITQMQHWMQAVYERATLTGIS